MFGKVGYINGPAPFSPAALFAAGEQGVWYDPSDVANTLWRYNLLTWTEQFDNIAWSKGNGTISINSSVAPDGTTTADTLISAASTAATFVQQAFTSVASAYTATFYVKASGAQFVQLLWASSQSTNFANFDIVNGTVGTNTATSATISQSGSGWYRISITSTLVAAAGAINLYIVPSSTSSRGASFAGNGTSGIIVWGAQLELGTTATIYQPITNVNSETIARFPQATLYQDFAGTTPVTSPAQPVGLMLSKDKNLALGPDLARNGNFSSGTNNWSTVGTASFSVVNGEAQLTNCADFTSRVEQAIAGSVSGKTYMISMDIRVSSASVNVQATQNGGGFNSLGVLLVSSTSTQRIRFFATTINGFGFILQIVPQGGSASQIVYFDNVVVQEVLGTHATQSTSASRPTYGIVPATGRRNLFLQTEDFSVSPWAATVLGTSTRVNTTSPYSFGLGLITATSANGGIRQMVGVNSFVSGQTGSLTFFVQSASSSLSIVFENGTATYGQVMTAALNPSDGTAGALTGFTSATSVPFGTGYIYTLNMPAAGGTLSANVEFRLPNGASMLLGRPQIQVGSATAYQRVVTAFEVTEANVASLSYLSFDGIDDFMVTPTITPGTDKVQVFAGVRKLSDAAAGVVAEMSVTSTTNNGSFAFLAPVSAANNLFWRSRGSATAEFTVAGYNAPISTVITGLGDISNDLAVLRANGTQIGQSGADQGTGNYLAYPMFIGRRGGTSLPFNGNLFGLITRFGANLTTTAISRTESWMSQETGVGV